MEEGVVVRLSAGRSNIPGTGSTSGYLFMFQLPPVYFERLLESFLDIVIAVDRRGQIIFYNDGASKTLGYTAAEVRDSNERVMLYPDVTEARRVLNALRNDEFGQKGQVKNFETTLVAKNGEHIPVSFSGSLIYDEQGEEVGSIGFHRVLREIHLPPEYFERLLENSLDIVIAVDRKGQIIFYNDGAHQTLGYTSAEIHGKRVWPTVYPGLEEARRVMNAMRSGEEGEKGKVKNFETTLVCKNGEHIPAAISGSLIYDAGGYEIGSVGFLKDLREIRRRDQLATLGELAVGLAHRINNPLEVIFNNLDVLNKHMAHSFPDEEYVVQEERVESIQRELLKIRKIITRIDEMAQEERYATTEYIHGSRMADLGHDEKDDPIIAPHHASRKEPTQDLAGLTILVVDDDLGVCYSLRDVLQEEGAQIEVATGGLQALNILTGRKVDIVVSDVVMPDLDGYDLYMEVRERFPETPVVLMTAYFFDKDHVIKRSKLEGLKEVIFKKPVDPDKLKEIILQRCRPEQAAD